MAENSVEKEKDGIEKPPVEKVEVEKDGIEKPPVEKVEEPEPEIVEQTARPQNAFDAQPESKTPPKEEKPKAEEPKKEDPAPEGEEEPKKEKPKAEEPKKEDPAPEGEEEPKKEDLTDEKPKAEEDLKVYEPFVAELKKIVPEGKYSTQEEILSSAVEIIGGLNDYKEEEMKHNKILYDILDKQPELVSIIKDMSNDVDFFTAILRHVDIDDVLTEEGDDGFEEQKKARKEYKDKRQTALDLKAKTTVNITKSTAIMDKFIKTKKMDDVQREQFSNILDTTFTNIIDGTITDTFLELMYSGINSEKTIKKAKKEIEIKLKNEKIEAKIEEGSPKGDGLPKPIPTGDELNKKPVPKKRIPFFTELEERVDEEKF